MRAKRYVLAAGTALVAASCNPDDFFEPSLPIELSISSPIDTVMARGHVVPLEVSATQVGGGAVAVVVSWESADPSIASITQSGVATGVNAGRTVITARSGTHSAAMPLRVVNANLTGIGTLLGDPLRGHLVAPLTTARATVEAALASADAALGAGHLLNLHANLTTVAAQADAASATDDRVLLATLRLLTDHAIRLLNFGSP